MAFYRGEQGSVKFDDAGSSLCHHCIHPFAWSMTIEKDVLGNHRFWVPPTRANIGGLVAGSWQQLN
jgi:hypothetical protein